MSVPLYEVDGITFSYGKEDLPVLRDCSLSLPEGGLTMLLGPNGMGKTTLLHLLLGWLRPQKGSLRLKGKPLGLWSRRHRGQTMALVPQGESTPFDYSLMEYLLLGRAPHLPPLGLPGEEDMALVRRVMDQVFRNSLHRPGEDHRVNALSGGEFQLMLLARALVQEPQLLLMDEPGSHLDPANRHTLMAEVNRLRNEGISVLMTTHDPQLALSHADRVVLLKEGRVWRQGSPKEIIEPEILGALYGVTPRIETSSAGRHLIWE